jgi:hypothetical protein
VREIYVIEAEGFPEIRTPCFIETVILPYERIEVIEWTGVGGVLIGACNWTCIRFNAGHFVKAYIGRKVTLATLFDEHYIDNVVCLSDNIDFNYETIMQLRAQYKELCRMEGRKETKAMLRILNMEL